MGINRPLDGSAGKAGSCHLTCLAWLSTQPMQTSSHHDRSIARGMQPAWPTQELPIDSRNNMWLHMLSAWHKASISSSNLQCQAKLDQAQQWPAPKFSSGIGFSGIGGSRAAPGKQSGNAGINGTDVVAGGPGLMGDWDLACRLVRLSCGCGHQEPAISTPAD